MNKLPCLSLAAFFVCCSPVLAQTDRGKILFAPSPEASRESVEKYVAELSSLIGSREAMVTRLVNEIAAYDKAIQESVDKVLRILTAASDSRETRSKVARLKVDSLVALQRAAQAYTEQRKLIEAELGTTKSEYRQEELFASRGQIDTRINNMVDAMLTLALSMETHEGNERYLQDSGIMVGGRRGISVPGTVRNPDYQHDKKQAALGDKVTSDLSKSLIASQQRLDARESEISAKLSSTSISEEEKTRLGGELERIMELREERATQQALLQNTTPQGGQNELDRKEFVQTEELVSSIRAGARRDFTSMMTAFTELRTERQALAALKAKLDHANHLLGSQAPAN